MPLTDIAIRHARPPEKARKLFDGGGLYLELSPRGNKWWRLKYRFAGKEKRISLGVYPAVSLKEARRRRAQARELLAREIDPSEHRKAQEAAKKQQSANSFEAVAREWFTKHTPNWAVSHANRVLGQLKRDIFPWMGRQPIVGITAPELLAVVRRIEQRGALESAHRALRICGQVFRYAVATGKAKRDPSGDLRGALPPVKRTHFAALTEPKQVGPLLRVLDGYQGTLIVRCALRIAPLVFVRPGELRHAQWSDIDLEAAEWRYTVSKTDIPHIVPLSRQAVEILQALHPVTGHGRYVFPSARTPNGARPMSENAILAALRRMGIGKEEMTGHGFRAMARTILDEVLGFRPDFIEHQLAHAVRDPNGRAYNRTAYLPERRKMMQEWADYLDQLKADVVPMHPKRLDQN
ncbi:MAG: integrase arm-type DNA-binding domain-containing protein [Acidobacteriota bacterium]|nr:integrase arm-type DNA-binding domain-containing protein [Acidobacteriota bacterium]